MGIIQEKFQVEAPEPKKPSHEWVSSASARRPYRPPAFSADLSGARGGFNDLPPGDTIEDQKRARIPATPRVMEGETDVTVDYTRQALDNGFTRRPYSPWEDSYTGEHADTFYGEMTVDGETGFIERGNALDRI